jgi:ribosomal protein S18 acetylase RimI-like enzyme
MHSPGLPGAAGPANSRRMSEVHIRRAGPGDEDALALVGQASFLEAFAGVIGGPDIIAHCHRQHAREKYVAWLADPRTEIWLAEIDPARAPVGYLVLTSPDLPLPDIPPEDLEVKRVYLLHRFQGGGVGRRLMQEAADSARRRGSRRLLLGVYGGNKSAIAFYRRLGYAAVGTRRFLVGSNTYEDLILGLNLAPWD